MTDITKCNTVLECVEFMHTALRDTGLEYFYYNVFSDYPVTLNSHCDRYEDLLFYLAQYAVDNNPELAKKFNPLFEDVAIDILKASQPTKSPNETNC